MTLGTFDLTENMQASVRMNTGCHRDQWSLGICIMHPANPTENNDPCALELMAYDAVEWCRALAFARWINEMETGGKHTIPEPDARVAPCVHCGCPKAFITQDPTNIFESGQRLTEVTIHCQLCGSMTHAHAKDYQTARDEAMRTWEARA